MIWFQDSILWGESSNLDLLSVKHNQLVKPLPISDMWCPINSSTFLFEDCSRYLFLIFWKPWRNFILYFVGFRTFEHTAWASFNQVAINGRLPILKFYYTHKKNIHEWQWIYTFRCRHEPCVLCYYALLNLKQVRTPVAIYIPIYHPLQKRSGYCRRVCCLVYPRKTQR